MRSTSRETALRTMLTVTRGTIVVADDDHKMQQVQARGHYGELHPAVERFQTPGFSSVPLPPDKDGNGADCLIAYVNSNHGHPIVFSIDDRRTRPMNGKPGDVTMYHNTGSSLKLTDDGFTHDMGKNKKPLNFMTGKGSVKIEDGKVTLTDDKTTVVVEGSKITCTVGGTSIVITDGKIALGGEGASLPVMLQGNVPSTLVFATK